MKPKDLFSRMFVVTICFLTFFCLVAIGTATAATYYVATNGIDSNPGTQTQPFKTIQKAADTVNPGDTVIVKNGLYRYSGTKDNYFINMRRSGTAVGPITFKAENVRGAVLDGNNLAHSIFNLIGNNLSYITINGFEIRNARWGGIWANNPSYPAHHITLSQNNIHDIGRRVEPAYAGCYGIVGVYTGLGSHDFTLDGNQIHDIGRLNPETSNEHNWIHDHGWYNSCAYNATAINNVFYNCNHGWSLTTGTNAKNIRYINNTFIGANPLRDGQIIISGMTGVTDLLISSNIFYQPRNAAVWWYAWNAQSITSAIVRNNITTASAIDSVLSSKASLTKRTLSGNLLKSDPKLVNAAGRDYHIQSDSPAINRAYASDAPNYDFDRLKRPQGVGKEAGAFEYQIPASAGLMTGAVAYYKLDEGTGQFITDSSGKGTNATLGISNKSESSDPTWTTGMAGYGLMSTANNVVTIPRKASLDNLKKFTVSAWINPADSGDFPRIISTESSNGFFLCVNPASGFLGVSLSNTAGGQLSANVYNVIKPNQWNHVVMTYDDAGDRKCHLYVNGFEFQYSRQDTVTGTLKTSATDWKIGNNLAANRAFNGRMDNLRIYNRALSASEIAGLYNEESGS